MPPSACAALSLLLFSLLPSASSDWLPAAGCQAEACTVAILLAGPFRGTEVSASEFRRVLLRPLLSSGFKVDTFAAGPAAEHAAWTDWLASAGAGEGVNASAHFLELPSDEATLQRFPEQEGYFNGECADKTYHLKYHHLLVAWRDGAEAHRPGGYDFAVRTRVDLSFGAFQFFKPCWLWEVDKDTILVANKEHHSGAYLYQLGLPYDTQKSSAGGLESWTTTCRPPQPDWFATQNRALMMDQFWAGSAAAMSALLSVAAAPPVLPKGEMRRNASARCRHGNPLWEAAGVDFLEGPEMVFADFLWRRNLSFYPVNLGLAKVPKVPPLRMPPCLLCFDCYSADPFVRVR